MAARKTSQPRGAGGKFKAHDLSFTVVADAENAIQTFEDVKSTVGEVEMSMENLGSELGEVSGSMDRASDSTKTFNDGLDTNMVNLTMGVSALNQMTGALYKTIGGLEAAGVINQEVAQDWQENARVLELLTGPLEFVVSLMLAYSLAVHLSWIETGAFTAAVTKLTGGAGLAGLGKSLGIVASGIGSLVTGILVVVAVVLTVIAVFKLWEDRAQVLAYWNNVIADSLDRIGRGADRAKEAIRDFFSIDLLGDIGNLVSGGDPASEAQGGV